MSMEQEVVELFRAWKDVGLDRLEWEIIKYIRKIATPNPEAEALVEAAFAAMMQFAKNNIHFGDTGQGTEDLFSDNGMVNRKLFDALSAYRAKHPKEGSAAKESGSSQKLEE